MRELSALAADATKRLEAILGTGKYAMVSIAAGASQAYVSGFSSSGVQFVEIIPDDDDVPAAIERLLAKATASRQPTEAEIYATLGVEMRDRREMGRDAA